MRRIPRCALPLSSVLGAALLVLVGAAQAGEGEMAKPKIVKIHADWCGTCQKLDSTWSALQGEVGGQARLVILDVTTDETSAVAAKEADALGIRAFFDKNKNKTGTVGLLRADGSVADVWKGELDPAVYAAAIGALNEA